MFGCASINRRAPRFLLVARLYMGSHEDGEGLSALRRMFKSRQTRRILRLMLSLSSICFCFTWLFSILVLLARGLGRPCGGSAGEVLRPRRPHLLGADLTKRCTSCETGDSQAHRRQAFRCCSLEKKAGFVAPARESGHCKLARTTNLIRHISKRGHRATISDWEIRGFICSTAVVGKVNNKHRVFL